MVQTPFGMSIAPNNGVGGGVVEDGKGLLENNVDIVHGENGHAGISTVAVSDQQGSSSSIGGWRTRIRDLWLLLGGIQEVPESCSQYLFSFFTHSERNSSLISGES
jgi:hypothetical protein